MPTDRFDLPLVYPITDKRLARRPTHLSILRELARGGARLVQLRDKSTPLDELLPDLLRCVEFAEKHSIVLIVNDRCDLVLCCGARGVHLGQDDLPPEAARAILPRQTIGWSTHTPAQVRRSRSLPVDYIGFGPVFATSTKENPCRLVGLSGLRKACSGSSKPVVAIGGIGLEQIREVREAGAASAAVISALMTAPSLARTMEQFLKAAE
jgi:thiamine-phosphate pyrophosphorylase